MKLQEILNEAMYTTGKFIDDILRNQLGGYARDLKSGKIRNEKFDVTDDFKQRFAFNYNLDLGKRGVVVYVIVKEKVGKTLGKYRWDGWDVKIEVYLDEKFIKANNTKQIEKEIRMTIEHEIVHVIDYFRSGEKGIHTVGMSNADYYSTDREMNSLIHEIRSIVRRKKRLWSNTVNSIKSFRKFLFDNFNLENVYKNDRKKYIEIEKKILTRLVREGILKKGF
jgi:hypothetical protein